LNPQGHVRKKNLQIGEHSDTGGQIVYILELAKQLENLGCQVDIVTRQIIDNKWKGYSKLIERFSKYVTIYRIPFLRKGFIRKELLWNGIYTYAKRIYKLYEQEIKELPDIFTSH
jgi:sucrose-phosphate synthase